MDDPSPRASRLAIAAGLTALLTAGGGFLLGRATTADVPKAPAESPAPLLTPAAASAADKREIRRRDLLSLGASAADATATNRSVEASSGETPRRRFELVLPFGCDGPTLPGSPAGNQWRYDEAASVVRLHIAPISWATSEWVRDGRGVDAIEGFWIERPWSSSETCPAGDLLAAAPDAEPVTLPGQSLGIAQILTRDTPRQLDRDGRAYDAVVRRPAEMSRFAAGLQLRLRGRLAAFPAGGVTRCLQRGGREQRPVCLIAAAFDEVAVVDPISGDVLASWQPTAGQTRSDGEGGH